MKRLSLLLCFCLMLSLAACTVNDPSPKQTPKEVIEPAMEAYGWFEFGYLDYDSTESKTEGDKTFYLAVDPRFDTYEKFYDYLLGTFSKFIIDEQLMPIGRFGMFDDKLYMQPGGRAPNDNIGNVSYELVSEDKNKIEYKAVVEYLEDPNSNKTAYTSEYKFVREKIDGVWVFTTFEYFY